MSVAHSHVTEPWKHADPPDWIKYFARAGYVAKGIVYLLVGGLAIGVAFGEGGQTTGSRGALRSLADEPFGMVMLVVIGLGLLCYAAWRAAQVITDPDTHDDKKDMIMTRIKWGASGTIYFLLGLYAINIGTGLDLLSGAAGGGGGSGGSAGGQSGTQSFTAQLMSQPFGVILVGLIGAILIAFGGWQVYSSVKEKFWGNFKTHEMDEKTRKGVKISGKIGRSARGIVFAVMGVWLIQAAITHNPQQAGGLGKVLRTTLDQPWGNWLLGAMAIGLMLYGAFMCLKGRYRRIPA